LAYGATALTFAGYAPQLRGNMALTPRYRKFSVRPDSPEDAAWTDGTAVTTTTPYFQSFNISALGSFMFVQPALAAASSTSNGEAFSVWQAFTDSVAQIVVRQAVQLQPDLNTSQTAYIPLGKPFPALGLSGVMLAIAARGCSGSPGVNVVARTYTGDPSNPSAWGSNLMAGDKTFSSTNEDYNTGNLVYAPTSVAWAELGLKVPAGSFYGSFDIVAAAKY
jgi:hypothetical protein